MSNLIPIEDMNYLTQQSKNNLNLIISGMASLMNDTEKKVTAMESQNWFQRMTKTLFGKNKATKEEIRRNTDKLNSYMTEALSELYNRNLIDEKIIMSLGIQLNELYKEHLQLKQMMGVFVDKLNKKIERIDNYHLLIKEIELGEFSKKASIVELCKIMSQLDKTTIQDDRKMGILKKELIQYNVVTEEEVLLIDYLKSLLEIPMDEVGAIYLELQTMKDNFMAALAMNMIEKYHFLPEMTKKLKNKNKIIEEVISEQRLDENVTLGTEYIFDEFVNSKTWVYNNFVNVNQIEYTEQENIQEIKEVDYIEKISENKNEILQDNTNDSQKINYLNNDDKEDLEWAKSAYDMEMYDIAFDIFKYLADKGYSEAKEYLKKLAKKGIKEAQDYLNQTNNLEKNIDYQKEYIEEPDKEVLEQAQFFYEVEEFKATFELIKSLIDKGSLTSKKYFENIKKDIKKMYTDALNFQNSKAVNDRIEARKIYRKLLESDLYLFYPEIKQLVQKQMDKLEGKS